MFKRDLTIMVASHSSGRVRAVYVPRAVLVAAVVFVVSAAATGGAIAASLYYKYQSMAVVVEPTAVENKELTLENRRLAKELRARDSRINDLAFKLQKERDDYAVSLERLDANLKKLEKFYTDLRIIAGFKLDAGDAKRLGAGGPSVPHEVFYDYLYKLHGDRFMGEARRREVSLNAECSRCEGEFAVLMRLLERRKSLLADTPNIVPVKGIITSWYGARRGRGVHGGLDIGAAAGTPIIAPADGVVKAAGPYPSYGNVVILDHGTGFSSRYGHLSRVEVKTGDRVVRGDIIGRVGATGWATGNHLHYEIRINNVPVDPYNYLGAKLPVHIVDGSNLKIVAMPDDADMLISDEDYAAYENKRQAEGAVAAPPSPATGE